MQCHFGRTIILIAVVASLCFSVGEGLRLTPFPLSSFALHEAPTDSPDLAIAKESSRYKYGPLDVPAQSQKRSKRQTFDVGLPPSQVTDDSLNQSKILLKLSFPVSPISLVSVSRPSGRAPPPMS